MLSVHHEGLAALFRNRPEFAPEVLRDKFGVTLPAWSEARLDSSGIIQALAVERPPGVVVLLAEGRPVCAIVVEVQLEREECRRSRWPQFLTYVNARLNCPTTLLVVAPEEALARWCARPVEVGPGFVINPLVLGPGDIPAAADG
jgi:hypothetical protein